MTCTEYSSAHFTYCDKTLVTRQIDCLRFITTECPFSTNIPVIISQLRLTCHSLRLRSRYYQPLSPQLVTSWWSLPFFWIQTKIFARHSTTLWWTLDWQISLLGFSALHCLLYTISLKAWNVLISNSEYECTWRYVAITYPLLYRSKLSPFRSFLVSFLASFSLDRSCYPVIPGLLYCWIQQVQVRLSLRRDACVQFLAFLTKFLPEKITKASLTSLGYQKLWREKNL